MFRCQHSGKNSRPGEKPVRVVTETRDVTYYKTYINKETGERELAIGKNGQPIIEGTGYETVEEILMLPSEYEKLKQRAKEINNTLRTYDGSQ